MVLALVVVAASACGGGSDSSDTTAPDTPEVTTAASLVPLEETTPSTTLAAVEGDIETPAEAAAALVAAGVTCDRYLDSGSPDINLGPPGPPSLDGSCENGDLEINIAVFEGDAGSMMDAMIPAYAEFFKGFGVEEIAVVNASNVSYGVEGLKIPQRRTVGRVPIIVGATLELLEPVTTEAELDLLNQIAEATGGELKIYEL
jgi:hypothetical protein